MFYNTIYMIALPFIAVYEIFKAVLNAIYRDMGWSDVSNEVAPAGKEAWRAVPAATQFVKKVNIYVQSVPFPSLLLNILNNHYSA